MQNFTLDYQQLPFTQVTVTSVDANAQTFNFSTIPGFQSPADFNTNRAADASDAIWMFIFRNGVPIQQVGRLGAKRPVYRKYHRDQRWERPLGPPGATRCYSGGGHGGLYRSKRPSHPQLRRRPE